MGCSSTIVAPKVTPAANLTSACEELEDLPEGANMGDLLEVSIRNNQAYAECSSKHKKLSEWVK